MVSWHCRRESRPARQPTPNERVGSEDRCCRRGPGRQWASRPFVQTQSCDQVGSPRCHSSCERFSLLSGGAPGWLLLDSVRPEAAPRHSRGQMDGMSALANVLVRFATGPGRQPCLQYAACLCATHVLEVSAPQITIELPSCASGFQWPATNVPSRAPEPAIALRVDGGAYEAHRSLPM